jgi:hypothetical protein
MNMCELVLQSYGRERQEPSLFMLPGEFVMNANES